MIDWKSAKHHPAIEDITTLLCTKTSNPDRGFFQVATAYFLGKMASTMRATVATQDRGVIPINVYAIALADSGYGKGHSMSILEDQFIQGFRDRFYDQTYPHIAEIQLGRMASMRSAISGKTEDFEMALLQKEFEGAGEPPFSFDSATPAAVKQLRHKLLMADCGSINLQTDEIGSNLTGSVDTLNVYLELYDLGRVKQKLIKNTADNTRGKELDGTTPANMLLFGTPVKLFDGSQTEEQFNSMLETGYARRCIFGVGQTRTVAEDDPAVLYQQLTNHTNDAIVQQWSTHFMKLADLSKHDWQVHVSDAVGIELLRYKLHCEKLSMAMAEHEAIQRAEMDHRYSKALKLAGAFAFVDESTDLLLDHLVQAVKLVEESGETFQKIMAREKPYMRLAKYIAGHKQEVTHADLDAELPFYKSSLGARNEIMTMATAWGYKNNIIIKKNFVDGIEFFEGETLEETTGENMIFSYSNDFAYNYQHQDGVRFDKIAKLMKQPDLHWANHRFVQGHRHEDQVIPGFNMLVLDVDGTTTLKAAHELLKEYNWLTYTTKRHTDQEHRFRLLMPINYHLEMSQDEYKALVNNVIEWLPFEVDTASNQRSKKWLTNSQATIDYNDGMFLDILPFIPKTSKNAQHNQKMSELQSLDSLERWFAGRIASGNRNNELIKFALALVDAGQNFFEVEQSLLNFNSRLSNGLSEDELRSTILVTVAKKAQKAQAATP